MKEAIKKEMISAMKSKNKERLSVIRLINGKITDALKEDENTNLVSVLDSMVKERNKSIESYLEGGAEELAKQEEYEITVINEFLPQRMDILEIEKEAEEVIKQTGASSMRDMGKVMGILKGKLGDTATPSDIATAVKSKLS